MIKFKDSIVNFSYLKGSKTEKDDSNCSMGIILYTGRVGAQFETSTPSSNSNNIGHGLTTNM